jgi:hypothetical protein
MCSATWHEAQSITRMALPADDGLVWVHGMPVGVHGEVAHTHHHYVKSSANHMTRCCILHSRPYDPTCR